MKSRQYSDEFKEKIIQECQEVGNVALVARRYEISPNTIHTWLRKYRQLGTVRSLKRGELANVKAMSEVSPSIHEQFYKKDSHCSIMSEFRGSDRLTKVTNSVTIKST